MGRTLARRVKRLEATREACASRGGRGALSVVFTARAEPPAQPKPCPACGRSLIVQIHELTLEEWHGREDACA